MKKSLLAVALLSTFGVAVAETSVTVYGTVDAGVGYNRGSNAAGSVTSLESGQQQYSRLGFRGVEDLGGNLKAMFVLEQGIQINDGTSGLSNSMNNIPSFGNSGLFSSQAYLGLAGGFGTVKLGRLYSPMYMAHAAIDPFASGFAADINNFFGTDAFNNSNYQRMSNAISYGTNDNMYGFKGSVAYGFGGQAGSTSQQSQIGASIGYDNGPLTVAYSYHHANNDVPGALFPQDTFKSHFIGLAYSFGVVKAHAAFDDNRQGDSLKTQDYMLGVSAPLASNQSIFADYTHKKNKLIGDANADQYAVGYTYGLSKRTNLYGAYAYVRNQDNSFVNTDTSGTSVSRVQVGVRHTF